MNSSVPHRSHPSQLIFLLDYDGTLTDFTQNPQQAHLSLSVKQLLYSLQIYYPIILVTGRHVQGLLQASRLVGFPIIGTHGFEAYHLPNQLKFVSQKLQIFYAHETQRLRKNLSFLCQKYPNLHLESKPYSCTLHYRTLPWTRSQIQKLHRQFVSIFNQSVSRQYWKIQIGKKMIEALPRGFSKGQSVIRLLQAFPNHYPIYAGDDLTDISVFKQLRGRGLRIAVGSRIPDTLYDLQFPAPHNFVSWLRGFLPQD